MRFGKEDRVQLGIFSICVPVEQQENCLIDNQIEMTEKGKRLALEQDLKDTKICDMWDPESFPHMISSTSSMI